MQKERQRCGASEGGNLLRMRAWSIVCKFETNAVCYLVYMCRLDLYFFIKQRGIRGFVPLERASLPNLPAIEKMWASRFFWLCHHSSSDTLRASILTKLILCLSSDWRWGSINPIPRVSPREGLYRTYYFAGLDVELSLRVLFKLTFGSDQYTPTEMRTASLPGFLGNEISFLFVDNDQTVVNAIYLFQIHHNRVVWTNKTEWIKAFGHPSHLRGGGYNHRPKPGSRRNVLSNLISINYRCAYLISWATDLRIML